MEIKVINVTIYISAVDHSMKKKFETIFNIYFVTSVKDILTRTPPAVITMSLNVQYI